LRIIYSILLLLVIAIRPTSQLGTLGYYQLNIDTIVEKYCVNKAKPKLQCNGKCYLSKQLTRQQSIANAGEKSDTSIIEAFFPVFFETAESYRSASVFMIKTPVNWEEKKSHFFDLIYLIDAPPKLRHLI